MLLRDELRVWAGHRSPRLIVAAFAVALAARVAVGRWSWRDLVVAGVILAAEPFTEWLVHVFVLHARRDTLLAREHRRHHADPRDRELVFVPFRTLVVGLPLAAALALLLAPHDELALTGLVTGYGMLGLYEWTHHLIHSAYRPRHRYYRSIWRAHRNHHFRNERYWFGVTVNLADRVLGTMPAKDAVPLSPTARTLGG